MPAQTILQDIFAELSTEPITGKVADYIPELAKIAPQKFGVNYQSIDGQTYQAGDAHDRFSIQSISKVLSLALVYREMGQSIWHRVGREPSGNPFNSLVQLEANNGIPRNPFINAGALVVCDLLLDLLEDPMEEMLRFVRYLSGMESICYNEKVAASERETGHRNRALAQYIKSFGNIHHEVEQVLDFYFHICSLEMCCSELSNTLYFLANDGVNQHGQRILTRSQTKRINAIMLTCGFYDEAGEFAYRVGLPGKSGVGGGIVAIHPEEYVITVWSPPLNKKGNSQRGMDFLEEFTTRTASSIF